MKFNSIRPRSLTDQPIQRDTAAARERISAPAVVLLTAMTWDLTSYFAEFNGADMLQFKEALRADIDALQRETAALPILAKDNAHAWEGVLARHEDLIRRMSHLSSFISCLASADARNEAYVREEAALARWRAEVAKIRVEFLRALKDASDEIFSSLAARPALAGAGNYLNRLREEARRAMSPPQEIVAADLAVDGIQAWSRLYDTMASKLEFDMIYPDGRRERVPMSQRRSLMDHRDRRVRKAAFEGGNEAWQKVADVA
ncbi:MAG TPA: hypothetical protein VMT22_21320, partial [Terriglobales bacterium]|nr:hypothetical protein [Terriglobales bacterium]